MNKEIKEILDKYKVEILADNYGGDTLTVISDSISDSAKTYEGMAFDELEKELDDHIRLKQAEAQLTGFLNREQDTPLREVVTAMNLTKEELSQLKQLIPSIIDDLEKTHGDIGVIIENWEQFKK